MYVKVPEPNRCCCCLPLRYGIVMFGITNVILSLLAVAFLVATTELKKASVTGSASLEEVTTMVLYSILGMGVIINIVLLVGGCQKDISMLRLYNFYATLTIMAAVVPLIILVSRRLFSEVTVGCLAIVMQVYVAVLVRSETMKLEEKLLNADNLTHNHDADAPDTVTLL